MIQATNAFIAKVQQESRRFAARFLLNGAALDCSFRSLVVHKGCASEDDGFTIGTCYSSYVEAVVYGLTDIIDNEELQMQIGVVLDDDSIDYITIGYYTATQPKKTQNLKTFTAYGRITSKFGDVFTPPATATLANIASALSTQTGVTVTLSGIPNTNRTITESMADLTCYEALAVLATAAGGFATETASGGVIVTKYSTVNAVTVSDWEMHDIPEIGETDYEVTGVKVVVSEASEDEDGAAIAEVSYVSGYPNLFISSEYITESIFDDVLAPDIVGYTFRPAAVAIWHGDPRLEATDTLLITDGETVHAVPCHEITITFDGGIIVNVTAYGGSDSDDDSASPRPITQKLERYAADLVTVKKAIIDRAKITDLQATNAQITNLQATKAYVDALVVSGVSANTLIADAATIASLSSNYLKVDATNIGSAVINKIYGDYGLISNLQIVNGKVTGSLAAVTISGDLITANTIVADRLIYSGTDGIYYELNANGGTLTPQQLTDSKYQSALDGSVIVASSITANQIAAGTITADQIAAATITAAKINMTNLQANIAHVGDTSAQHVLIDNNSVDIKNGNTLQASLGGSGMVIYASDGATEIARFAADGITLGDRNNAHQYVDYKTMKIVDREGDVYFGVYDMRGEDGFATLTDYFVGDGVTTCFTISMSSSEVMDVTINTVQVAATDYIKTHDSVTFNQPPATEDLIAIVYKTNSSAVKYYTLGERRSNSTNGVMSVASGAYVEASGTCSHAEGSGTIARGNFSHAEGEGTTASGDGSHASGFYTEANEDNQTVIGKFNDFTTQNKAFVVGNGRSDSARSNALTVDWGGDVKASRDVIAGRDIIAAGTVNIADSIKRKTYTWTIASIGANEYTSTEVSPPSESGYAPIGIIGKGIDGTGTASALWVKCHIRPSDNKLVIGIKNDNSTARTNWTATVYILYAKS